MFLDYSKEEYFLVQNGYCLSDGQHLDQMNKIIFMQKEWEEGGALWEQAKEKVSIGVHADIEILASDFGQKILKR